MFSGLGGSAQRCVPTLLGRLVSRNTLPRGDVSDSVDASSTPPCSVVVGSPTSVATSEGGRRRGGGAGAVAPAPNGGAHGASLLSAGDGDPPTPRARSGAPHALHHPSSCSSGPTRLRRSGRASHLEAPLRLFGCQLAPARLKGRGVIHSPVAYPLFLCLLLLLGLLVAVFELRIIAYAYRKVGVRPRYVFAVLLLSLLGSQVNIPIYLAFRSRAGARRR